MRKHIKTFIDQGIIRTNKEKELFDKEFKMVSDRIALEKENMRKKSKERSLIRNR
ncbi:hypothetical protein JNUCC32_13355 [Paenibacillus sp. JNUCC32]|uniref:hypothetical protein n=1 Tax=Paenibacillus sp. JNUCC32 TaxID=2777984 RepID=UPI001787C470|nr:hypothetical protein [Paenibacillus sp. JNUCC-32]QOT12944.1 hypothetical protein JNUCC32_13355 [Paenibacillus sp. JNUCC-32]